MDEFTWARKGRWEAQPNNEHQPSQKCALHILPSSQRLNQWTDGFISVGLRIYIRFGESSSVIWSNNGALNHLFISFWVIIREIGYLYGLWDWIYLGSMDQRSTRLGWISIDHEPPHQLSRASLEGADQTITGQTTISAISHCTALSSRPIARNSAASAELVLDTWWALNWMNYHGNEILWRGNPRMLPAAIIFGR